MARPESVALGGYYPTPPHLVGWIAHLLDASAIRGEGWRKMPYTLVDPCAGKGEAIVALRDALFPPGRSVEIDVYAAELEGDRAEILARNLNRGHSWSRAARALHGDAFNVEFDGAGAHILYLNPPYDHDHEHGRLEQRFLDRFTAVLRPGEGVLVFVVPRYALAASAAFIAQHYTEVACVRFPDGDYEVFQQVVLVARRRSTPAVFPSREIEERVQGWAVGGRMPVLAAGSPSLIALAPNELYTSIERWKMAPFDAHAAYQASRPWMIGTGDKLRPVRGLGFDGDVGELLRVRYRTIMPPRAAHVAVALASGLVNGFDVQPDDPQCGLPAIMVKGTFAKEYRTVEEKRDKEGAVKALIQVQQPKLRVTVLDMASWTYHDLRDGAEPTGSLDFAEMNVADLLRHYGRSLAQLMHQQCPPLADPGAPAITLPELGLRPFRAQAQAITAGLRALLTDDPAHAGESLFILGEVGTGKTLITLALLECLTPKRLPGIRAQIGGRRVRPVRRVLVVCPPHLLSTWEAEVSRVLPAARVMALSTVGDVEAARRIDPELGDAPGAGLVVLLLSREMAKLGHAWDAGVSKRRSLIEKQGVSCCPDCGAPVDALDAVRRRLRCDRQAVRPVDGAARRAVELAHLMASAGISDANVDRLVTARVLREQMERRAQQPHDEGALPLDVVWQRRAAPLDHCIEATPIGRLLRSLRRGLDRQVLAKEYETASRQLGVLVEALLVADHPDRDEWIAATVGRLYEWSWRDDQRPYSSASTLREKLRVDVLTLIREVGCEAQRWTRNHLRELDGAAWNDFDDHFARLVRERANQSAPPLGRVHAHDGTISVDAHWGRKRTVLGSTDAARRLLETLVNAGTFDLGEPCGAPLFQAVPRPRRYPLASYIAGRFPDLFDILVIDEAHEYAHDGSAQERAAHRLTELGKPTLLLTGTSNNGYSSSLFSNTWAVSRRFRAEFARNDLTSFVSRYGYRKVRVEHEDNEKSFPVRYGEVTDRVESRDGLRMRAIGEAPGVLPLFIFKHMLPSALVIHKDDLDIDLPPMREIPAAVELSSGELRAQYTALRERLMTTIKTDLFGERAGKLWGQMAQLPSYLDRAHSDTGNTGDEGDRRYEIRYPESVGGELVATAFPLPASELTPKEEWLLETVQAEIDSGRPVMVFVWNTNSGLAARIERLVADAIGNHVVTLDAQKVQAGKRQAWIDTHVVKKKRRVLIVNPKAVETGLNNLTYFPTVVWQQNPNCSPIIYSQANGRVHRPGQTADEVRVYVPYYAATSQEVQFTLLGHKVQASRQTDGLDITTALAAAGVGGNDSHIDAMTIGRAIYEMLTTAKPRSAPARRPAVATSQLDLWGAA